jgi:hypothetical protein
MHARQMLLPLRYTPTPISGILKDKKIQYKETEQDTAGMLKLPNWEFNWLIKFHATLSIRAFSIYAK